MSLLDIWTNYTTLPHSMQPTHLIKILWCIATTSFAVLVEHTMMTSSNIRSDTVNFIAEGYTILSIYEWMPMLTSAYIASE